MATSALAFMQRLPGGPQRWRLWAMRSTNLLLIVLCAVSLARIVWALWPEGETATQTPPLAAGQQRQANQADKALNMTGIYNAHLFGRVEANKPTTSETAPIDAPETRLNLVLTGIMAASETQQSRALIKDGSGKQRPYAVGDDLPGNARLSSIHSDRVILERAGRYETLRMEQKQDGGSRTAGRSESRETRAVPLPGPADLSADTVAKLSTARREILQDPSKASQYIRIQPVYNQGQLKGYRLYPGKDRELFKDAGLRAGELLTSVNGVQLDDPTRALQMLTDLSQATEVNITLERAGQSRSLNIVLNQ